MLTAKFEQWPWDWFDGIPVAEANPCWVAIG
jgi:hypothetical protein